MKLIIAGGRNYVLTQDDHAALDKLHRHQKVTEVVSGGANGADKGGEDWGLDQGIKIIRFPAYWKEHGISAGPIRNDKMAKYADAVALFPGGKGTLNMFITARARGIKVYDLGGIDERYKG